MLSQDCQTLSWTRPAVPLNMPLHNTSVRSMTATHHEVSTALGSLGLCGSR